MSTHNICFHGEIRKIFCGYPLLSVAMGVRLMIRRLQVRHPPGLRHSFMESDHEIFSTVILPLRLFQEGQLSVSGERMCTILVNCLEV